MSHVQLQVRPRRVRCSTSCEPPPFSFAAGPRARTRATGAALIARLPLHAVRLALVAVGHAVDVAFFLAAITAWCALHLTVWSYAFQIGPAATCFGLPCPGWVQAKLLLGCIALAVISFVASRILHRLGHRATSFVLVLLVTFDVSALLLLGVRSWT